MIIGARTLAKRAIVYDIRHTWAFDDISYKKLYGESKASEITEAIEDALPSQLNKMQKSRKVSNILQKMKKTE